MGFQSVQTHNLPPQIRRLFVLGAKEREVLKSKWL
jgi:hypothetical protein